MLWQQRCAPHIRVLQIIVELKVVGWVNLQQLPEAIQHLTHLPSSAQLGRMCCTEHAAGLDWTTPLRLLCIDRCTALQSLPNSIKCLTDLRSLSITGCPGLAPYSSCDVLLDQRS